MKLLFILSVTFIFLIIPVKAFGEGFDIALQPPVPALKELGVTKVMSEGYILKVERDWRTGVRSYLVGISVMVNRTSACTTYVGQETSPYWGYHPRSSFVSNGATIYRAMGSYDLNNDICIAIWPAPLQVTFGLKMVNNKDKETLNEVIVINRYRHAQFYQVQLNTRTEEVSVKRVK